MLAHGDVEFQLFVALIGLRATQIPGRARAAQHGAGEAQRPALFQGHDADIDIALLEDAVLDEKIFQIVADFQEGVAPGADVGHELFGEILMHAARAEVIGVHARARRALVEDHQLLALLEAPQRRGERAHVHGLRGHVEQMGENAADFGIEHADQLAALGHIHAQQLLDGQTEGMFLIHRRAIVEPVEVRHVLRIGARFHQLLGAAMQQADMRIDALHHFAIKLQHEAQHAMGRRMLRAEVDREITDGGLLGH